MRRVASRRGEEMPWGKVIRKRLGMVGCWKGLRGGRRSIFEFGGHMTNAQVTLLEAACASCLE